MPHLTEEQWNEKLVRLEKSGLLWSEEKWRSESVERHYQSLICNIDLEANRGRARHIQPKEQR